MSDFPQSALHPAAAAATDVAHLGLLMYVGLGTVLLLVIVLLVVAIRSRRVVDEHWWLIGGGLVLPLTVLGILLFRSLTVTGSLHAPPPAEALRIEVIGWQWWWEVRYPAWPGSQVPVVVLANELHLPSGMPVVLELSSADVIHSFWVPSLGGKVDMIPGRTNHLVIEDAREGRYRGQCAEFCGLQHAWMAFDVVVQSPAAFKQWLVAQAGPARAPTTPETAHGAVRFLRAGCAECHTIRGTLAAGEDGPDLTHVGSRLSLGAGRLANHPGNLGGWIAGSQDLKAGNAMPSERVLTGRDLRAVIAYLGSLQ
jgi:cytochrome c oxidase subunit 2